MSNFLKYMRLFALGITFSSSMALPYVQIKFYDVFREATQASNNELGLLMTIFTAVSMALYIPGGVLADRGSPKKLLLLSLIMMCGLNAYFAFHTSYGAAQLIWALLAIAANTVQWPTLIKAIRDTGSRRMAEQVRAIRYPNYKGAVHDEALHNACVSVWSAMARLQDGKPRR